MNISMDKKYRTRDGREVRLLCVDGPEKDWPVVGYIGEKILHWTGDGASYLFAGREDPNDLIEYHEPDIRTIWVNVYDAYVETYSNKTGASRAARSGAIAIAQPVTFEVKRT